MEHSTPATRESDFLQTLHSFYRQAERFALSLAPTREDARDLLQDALVIAWQKYDDIHDKAAMKTYVFTVLCNLNRRRFRKRRLEQALPDEYEDTIHDTELLPDRKTDSALVRDVINQLPDAYREALLLYEVHDLPVAEIAVIQHCSVSAVKLRLFRARRTVAKKLGVAKSSDCSVPTTLPIRQ